MKRFRILLPLLFLTVGLLLPKTTYALPELFSPSLGALDVVAEVNALRAEKGLAPYKVNSILMSIAQSHAEYQAKTGVLSHYGAGGSRPYQRAVAAGYSVAGDLSSGGFFGEDIHSGANLSAPDVVKIWQSDPTDLDVMISADLKDIGVGAANANGVIYYTLDVGLSSESISTTPLPTKSGSDPFASATATSSTSQPLVIVSTAQEDGIVYHIVLANDALWSIALAYDTTVDELKKLNKLATDDIFIGQKLVISKKELDTPTPQPSITVTFGIPTSTATIPVTPLPTYTATPIPTPPASRQSGSTIVGGILLLALIGAALGTWLGRRKPAA